MTPRRLRSAFIKAEDQAAEDDGLHDMEQIPTGRQTRLELRRLKLASRLADSDDAADEVEDADDDDADAQDALEADGGEAEEDSDEEEESESGDDVEEIKEGDFRRYSQRSRSTVQRYSPKLGEDGMGQKLSGPNKRHRPSANEDEEDEDDEDEEEDEEEDERERRAQHRYKLRDRSRTQIQPYVPGLGDARPRGAVRRGTSDRDRSRKRRAGGFSSRWSDDDDVADDLPSAPWQGRDWGAQGTQISGTPGGHRSNASGDKPWEVALGAGGPLGGGKDGKGNPEITPLEVDPSVSFDQVGGLDHYIKALKEMVFLPLVYPELFERFHISPPRGVLFYGPPGTGKTLVARALAASASRAGRKVAFFMRKGADVLSKWVGEAERQLRMLFEEAQRQQPAIIFFDEIDGLAPVRSSKQDQIHNSIVSTLLALMDGLDSRGSVVVIGATNRVDALDAALRRPGRFDRELVFPLPSLPARATILDIHTRAWSQPPSPDLLDRLAQLCVGYCGADLKALCTEASLRAMRRAYPQIYDSDEKLLIDPARVCVTRRDFLAAFSAMTPASHRSAAAHARPLPPLVAPVLQGQLQEVLGRLCAAFPPAKACLDAAAQGGGALPSGVAASRPPPAAISLIRDDIDDEDDDTEGKWAGAPAQAMQPRLLLCGPEGAGQRHLAPAVLYALEGLPVHALGLPALLSDASARSPEEAVVHAVIEARRAAPAILYLPHLQLWWDTAPASLRATLWMLLADMPPDLPLLLFATADAPLSELDQESLVLFGTHTAVAYELSAPAAAERAAFFDGVTSKLALPPRPPPELRAAAAPPPKLPRAPEALAAQEAAERERAEAAARAAYEADVAAVRQLRMTLRDVATKLLCDRRWRSLAAPVSPEDDPTYWERMTSPMDLATLLARVDDRQYPTVKMFLAAVALIPAAEKQYWGDDPEGIREISRACALEDEARMLVEARVPAALAARCEAIHAAGGLGPPPPGALADDPPPLAPLPARGNAAIGNGGGTGAGSRTGGLFSNEDADEPDARWKRHGRSSSRLRGEDLDRRIINTDPERLRRQIMEQRRLESGKTKVLSHTGKRSREEAVAEEPAEGDSADADANDVAADDAAEDVEQEDLDQHLVDETPMPQRPNGLLSPDSTAGASSDGAMTDAPESGHADPAEEDLHGEATHRTRSGSAASNLPSTLATFVAGNRRRTVKGEATVTKAPRVVAEEEGTPVAAPAQAPQPQRRGFADTFETFVTRGICDSPSTSAQAAGGDAPEAAAAPESAPAAAAGAAAAAADGALLSPVPAGGGSRAAAEPASAGGSVLGSNGAPEAKTMSRRPASKVLANTTRPNLPESAQLGGPAASAAKPARKNGVTWADLPSGEGVSTRHVVEEEQAHPESAAAFAGHTPFRTSRFAHTPTMQQVPEALEQGPSSGGNQDQAPSLEGHEEQPADVSAPEQAHEGETPEARPVADGGNAAQKRVAAPEDLERAASLKEYVVQVTEGFLLQALEEVHSVLNRCVRDEAENANRGAATQAARNAVALFCDQMRD
ncbi:g8684 [Coccomyxa elongata]